MNSNTLEAGTVVGNRFQIEATIAKGGMGTIFRARDTHTDTLVALKVLHQLGTGLEEVARFSREAQVLASLRHPGVVSYVAHGQTAHGHYYLAMELLDGEDLARRLGRQPLSLSESLQLTRCVADALLAAHGRHFVHRDIKPSNLFLRNGRPDQVVVLDFGIARHALQDYSMTRTGLVIGTPDYMSPEQARGERTITHSTDIYSLGCVLFECLTGKAPFTGVHAAAMIAQILFDEPPKLTRLRPDLPARIEALVDSMLAKDPAQRPADCATLLASLEGLDIDLDKESVPLTVSNVQSAPVLADKEQRWVCVILAEGSIPSQSADLEVSREVLYSTHQHNVGQGLSSYGARVEWLPTGALIAAFTEIGNPNDQAMQAARCALAIKARWPEACVTLTTGRGILHERLLVGEAVDRAATLLRREADAKPAYSGLVFIDEMTARLLDARFDVREQETGVILLNGERTSVDEVRTLLGKPTLCLGRERELQALENTLKESVMESAARVVMVIAAVGMGKSRLRIEFLRRVRAQHPDVEILSGRGDQMTAGSVYRLIGQALRQLCEAHEGETLSNCQAKLRERVKQSVPAADVERVSAFLGELCSIPFPDNAQLRAARQDPRIMSDQVARAFQDFLRCECSKRPVLLILEDLHWGDPLTVKLIDGVLRELADFPFMVLALARPEVEDLFPRLWGERGRTDIRLAGLSKRAAERLVQQALDDGVAQPVMARIIEQAAGNALYLEELIRAHAEGKGDKLPETVLAMMQARILRLDSGARRVLRAAAVFGDTFWCSGVEKLLGQTATSTWPITVWIQALIDAEVIETHRTSRFTSESEYGFRHALMRDAAYSMLTEEDRKIGHRLAGEYLESIGDSNPLSLAEHFHRGDDVARAVKFFAQAADQSYEGADLASALNRAQRGIDCGAQGESLAALQSIQASAYSFLGDMQKALELGTRALEVLPVGGLRWCSTCVMLFLNMAVLGKHEALMALAQRFGEVEPEPEARAAYVEAAASIVIMLSLIGNRERARLFLARMQHVAAQHTKAEAGALPWALYGHARFLDAMEPDPWTVLTLLRQTTETFDKVGDRRMHAVTQADVGSVLTELRLIADAEATLRAGLAMGQRMNEPMATLWNQVFLVVLLAEHGSDDKLDEVPALAEAVIATVGSGSVYGGKALYARGLASLRRGKAEQAEVDLRAALSSMRVMPTMSAMGYAGLVEALLALGRAAEACEVAGQGLSMVDSLGGTGSTEMRLRLVAIKALRAAGDAAGAAQALQKAQQQLALRAAGIPDEATRARFLSQLPANPS